MQITKVNKKLKRYLLFGGPDYDASGGWADFIDSFDTIEDLYEKYEKFMLLEPWQRPDWYQAVDTNTDD